MRIDAADFRCSDPAREVRRTALLAQVDVFTAEPSAGNPAAVVLDAHAIPEAALGRIGAEMSLPASGSVHAALGVRLGESGLLRAAGDVTAFRAEQGDFLGRPGRLAVEVHLAGGAARRVRVGGQAVTVLTGRLRVT